MKTRISLLIFAVAAILCTSCTKEKPCAAFTYSLSTYENQVYFDNKSQGADHYQWTFGDGEMSTDEYVSHTFPVTEERKTFTVTLMAYPKSNDAYDICTKTITFPLEDGVIYE